jgi:hypothetical protein
MDMSLADKPINVVRGANNVPFDVSDRGALMPRLECGMTLLEHYAGLAMQGLLANNNIVDGLDEAGATWVAKRSAIAAKALIAELERTTP